GSAVGATGSLSCCRHIGSATLQRKAVSQSMNESIHAVAQQHRSRIRTPYYLIDERRLRANLEKIKYVREQSGAKAVLALKCFSTWSVFPLMRAYMDGTTSSSLYEAKLGHERFGGETHAYSVAFSESDVRDACTFASKTVFN